VERRREVAAEADKGEQPGPPNPLAKRSDLVGLSRLELLTSRLSGVCSNHLSYRPREEPVPPCRQGKPIGHEPNIQRRKRNEGGDCRIRAFRRTSRSDGANPAGPMCSEVDRVGRSPEGDGPGRCPTLERR
jgi:hypothetical protein